MIFCLAGPWLVADTICIFQTPMPSWTQVLALRWRRWRFLKNWRCNLILLEVSILLHAHPETRGLVTTAVNGHRRSHWAELWDFERSRPAHINCNCAWQRCSCNAVVWNCSRAYGIGKHWKQTYGLTGAGGIPQVRTGHDNARVVSRECSDVDGDVGHQKESSGCNTQEAFNILLHRCSL